MEYNVEVCKVIHLGRKKYRNMEYLSKGEKLHGVDVLRDLGIFVHESLKSSAANNWKDKMLDFIAG